MNFLEGFTGGSQYICMFRNYKHRLSCEAVTFCQERTGSFMATPQLVSYTPVLLGHMKPNSSIEACQLCECMTELCG